MVYKKDSRSPDLRNHGQLHERPWTRGASGLDSSGDFEIMTTPYYLSLFFSPWQVSDPTMAFVRGIAVIPTVRALGPLSICLLSKLGDVAVVVLLLLNVTGFWILSNQ